MFRATASINSSVVLLLVALTFLPLHRFRRLRDQIANRIVISNPLFTSLNHPALVFCNRRDADAARVRTLSIAENIRVQTAVESSAYDSDLSQGA
jgi:hypothetical protein